MTGDAMRDVLIECGFVGICPKTRDACRGCFERADRRLAAITAAPASARLALARAVTPDTHAVVPVEASDAMLDRGFFASIVGLHGPGGIYHAMIEAARKESK